MLCLWTYVPSSPTSKVIYTESSHSDIHEGVPTGNFETVHGLRTYVSNPKEASSGKQDTVIFLSDIFGVDLVNTKLVADEWAGQGYKVLLPDLFDNDPVPHQHLKVGPLYPSIRGYIEQSLMIGNRSQRTRQGEVWSQGKGRVCSSHGYFPRSMARQAPRGWCVLCRI
jgi:hypothetical protein